MNFFKRFFSMFESSSGDWRLKTIVYRGGVVTFRIPESWKEEYSDMDGGTFYDEGPLSGTLRVKVITMENEQVNANSGVELLRFVNSNVLTGEGSDITQHNGNNALLRYEQLCSERGRNLRIFYWIIANPVPPHHARIVTFSYPVLEEVRDNAKILNELKMLEYEIGHAEFARNVGV